MRISLWNPNSLRPRPIRFVSVSTSLYSHRNRFFRWGIFSGTMDSTPGAAIRSGTDYSKWDNADLIARITELESQLNSLAGGTCASTQSSSSKSRPAVARGPIHFGTEADTEIPITKELIEEPAAPRSSRRPAKTPRAIDPSKYNTRFIALKLAYLGQQYNGYEHANGTITPLPTIEEELFRALRKARLIFPRSIHGETAADAKDHQSMLPYSIDWEGCQYSKCGRTDRGVSAFGQVIGIRVRSAKPKRSAKKKSDPVSTMSTSTPGSLEDSNEKLDGDFAALGVSDQEESQSEEDSWDDVADELPYIQLLNKVLPKDIRILAWCPHPPADFDARFSCQERQYRYFFTQPAFTPTPGLRGLVRDTQNRDGAPEFKSRDGWLDIDAMREGARFFLGTHDFRNFCKIDTSKQITNFTRRISHADIEETTEPLGYLDQAEFSQFEGAASDEIREVQHDNPTVRVYTFTLHGSAFLWHQVRHMMGILFLIGQGLESPSIIPELLDVEKNPRRPIYEMASDAPLVLWDCVFPEKDDESGKGLDWIYAGDSRAVKPNKSDGKFGLGGVVDDMWSYWRQRKIDEILAASLLNTVVNQGDRSARSRAGSKSQRSQKIFLGGNEAKFGGKYTPLMQRSRLETVDDKNARYLANRQARKPVKNDGGGTVSPENGQ